ncbi:MAG: ABC transporter ATP-binding protein [Betaproteobacteria bacterium]|jgi:ABC-2 type transport system ATP-binding protein|nr:ABC transporter ATP-binding protein [Betaproteobacteria bacterium]
MSDVQRRGGPADHAIEVVGLVKRFKKVEAVRGISFAVPRGSATALLGGNGAGKTSTLSMLLGLLLPTAGTITILGDDIAHHRYRVLPRMNFTSPYVDLPKSLTVAENLKVFARLYGVPRIRVRIAELVDQLDIGDFLNRPYGTLSAGQRTRVSIAKALLNEPEVLLLDEPTASLDPDVGDRVRAQLMDYRHRSGATLLLASHNMPEVERMCDAVLMMRAGRIVDTGSPADLIARYGRRTMEEVFLDVARGAEAAAAPGASPEPRE